MFKNPFNKKYATEDVPKKNWSAQEIRTELKELQEENKKERARYALDAMEVEYLNRLTGDDNDRVLRLEKIMNIIGNCRGQARDIQKIFQYSNEQIEYALGYLNETRLSYEKAFVMNEDLINRLIILHPLSYRVQNMVKLLASLTENK